MLNKMSLWDKITAVAAMILGAVFVVLGVIGLFGGSRFQFTLPPVLGVLPLIPGYAMVVVLWKYWRLSNTLSHQNIFMCPRCQKVAALERPGKLRCTDCSLRIEIYDPLN